MTVKQTVANLAWAFNGRPSLQEAVDEEHATPVNNISNAFYRRSGDFYNGAHHSRNSLLSTAHQNLIAQSTFGRQ